MKNICIVLFMTISMLMSEEIIKTLSPFGITMGEKINKNIQLANLSGNIFVVNPDKPISDFSSYMVLLNKQELVSKVMALTTVFKNDDYCYASKRTYLKLEELINNKYGKATKRYDFLHADSIWKDNKDYKTSLRLNQRSHIVFWSFNDYTIILEEQADYEGCYIQLTYEKDDLIKEIIKDKTDKDSKSL